MRCQCVVGKPLNTIIQGYSITLQFVGLITYLVMYLQLYSNFIELNMFLLKLLIRKCFPPDVAFQDFFYFYQILESIINKKNCFNI